MQRILSFLALVILTAPLGAAPLWTIDQAQSRLGFVATWQESEFAGVFRKFDAHIFFDGKDVPHSRFQVTVDVTSADTQSPDRDEAMARPEWFFHTRFPVATFETQRIRFLGNEHYVAEAELTLKGITHPLTLPFTWREDGDSARMTGETVLKRTDFRIGDGEWSTGEMIGLDVKVIVELNLTR